jgi:hypothetical protein
MRKMTTRDEMAKRLKMAQEYYEDCINPTTEFAGYEQAKQNLRRQLERLLVLSERM